MRRTARAMASEARGRASWRAQRKRIRIRIRRQAARPRSQPAAARPRSVASPRPGPRSNQGDTGPRAPFRFPRQPHARSGSQRPLVEAEGEEERGPISGRHALGQSEPPACTDCRAGRDGELR